MTNENLNDLLAFLTVAEERSFTRAAAKIGVSQSALSQTIRGLEARIGVRLLNRTTRRVAPTEAGERLVQSIGPRIREIRSELAAVAELRSKPSGTVRLVASENAAQAVLLPKLQSVLPDYPDICVEIAIEAGLSDIVSSHYDAGIRPGEIVTPGMISVPVGPAMRMAVVGSPGYFTATGRPDAPQDLTGHNCINLRLPTHGGLYAWEFEKDGQKLKVRADGQLVVSTATLILNAAIGGFGLGYLTEQQVRPHIEAGQLERVLEDWCLPFPGYHLYYPDRRHASAAFSIIVDALRFRSS